MQAFYFHCVCFSKKFDTVTYLTKKPYIKDFFYDLLKFFPVSFLFLNFLLVFQKNKG